MQSHLSGCTIIFRGNGLKSESALETFGFWMILWKSSQVKYIAPYICCTNLAFSINYFGNRVSHRWSSKLNSSSSNEDKWANFSNCVWISNCTVLNFKLLKICPHLNDVTTTCRTLFHNCSFGNQSTTKINQLKHEMSKKLKTLPEWT